MEYAIEVLEDELRSKRLHIETLKRFARLSPYVPECELKIKELENAIQKLRGEK